MAEPDPRSAPGSDGDPGLGDTGATRPERGRGEAASLPERDPSATELEDIVADFILRREEGEDPHLDDYLARHPRHAEDLAILLSSETVSLPSPDDPELGAAPRASPGMPRRVGPYELLEHVSTAGGGVVYRARHATSHQIVALKVLDRITVQDPRDFERFRREAQILRTMDLVNVVPVLDAGEEEGRLYIATRWIEGETLADLRESVAEPGHRLHDLRERARLVARIARTFGAIHRREILHRDIKASNILVDRLGEPAIIDFGIASDPEFAEITATLDGPLGTPRYLPPEILRHGRAAFSPRSDMYGLGLCLYELCTGVRAFVQATRSDLFRQIVSRGPLDPRAARPKLPEDLAAIILRAIEIDPARRHPTMEALAEDLERFARGDAPDAATLRGARPWRRALRRHGRAAAVVLVLLGAGLWFGVDALGDWRIRRAQEARVHRAGEVIAPWALAAAELLPEDHDHLIHAVWSLAKEPVDDLRLRIGGAWILHLGGRYEDALIFLGPALEDEPREIAFLRAWLGLRIDAVRGAVSEGPPLEVHYLVPGMVNEKGEGFGNHFVVEDVEPYDLALEEIARRRLLAPPTLDEVEALLERFGDVEVSPLERFLRASVLWISLPADLDADPEAGALERCFTPFRREAERAAEQNPDLVWAAYIRGSGELRYGDPHIARGLLAQAVDHRPEIPALHHLLGLAAQRCAKPAQALRHFAQAAQLYEQAGRPCGRLLGAWALEEARNGNPEGAEQALDRWLGAARAWQDKAFPWLIRAEIAISAREFAEALVFLDRAAAADEHYALPLRRRAWLFEHHLGDPERASRIREVASLRMQQWPVSIDAYLRSSFFGTRPRAPSLFFAAGGAEPLPK